VFCGMLLAASCVHRTPPLRNTIVINQPFEAAWPAVIKTARDLNPDAVADMTTGTVTAEDFVAADRFRLESCAKPPRRLFPSWTDTRISAMFLTRPLTSGQTEVGVRCRFYRYNSHGNVWEPWQSLGQLEESLLAQVQAETSAR